MKVSFVKTDRKINFWSLFLLGLLEILPFSNALGQGSFDLVNRTTRVNFLYHRNLIILPVMINNQGPYQFIFDTGVSFMIITNPSLTEKLGLKPTSSILVKGFGNGKAVTARIVNNLSLKIGKLRGSGFSAAVLPLETLDFSNYVGIPIDGIIGFDLIKDLTTEIDFNRHLIKFEKADLKKIPKGYEEFPLFIENGRAIISVLLEISKGDSISLNLVLDTGGGNTMFLDLRSNPKMRVPRKSLTANLGWGINGPIEGKLARVESLHIRDIVLNNIIAAFPHYSDSVLRKSLENGNLGNEILRRFRVILDFSGKKLYLKKQVAFRSPFDYDMSGLGFTAEGPDYHHYIISSVDSLSPGEKAGLKTGDLILFIENNSAADYTLSEIDQLFRSGDHKVIRILYYRAGKLNETLLTLKRRI